MGTRLPDYPKAGTGVKGGSLFSKSGRTGHVRVPGYRPEVRVRKVPVTVDKTVTEVVAEKVPVTTAVRVPYQVRVCVPVVGCP